MLEKKKKVVAAKEESSDDSSDSSSDEEEVAAKKADSDASDDSDDSDSSDEEEEAVVAVKKVTEEVASGSDDSEEEESSDDDAEEEEEAKADSDDSSDASSSDDEEVENKAPKRKAEEAPVAEKKQKVVDANGEEESSTLRFGNLSWNVNDDYLTEQLNEAGCPAQKVRVLMDRETGRSRGYALMLACGYSHTFLSTTLYHYVSIDAPSFPSPTPRRPRPRWPSSKVRPLTTVNAVLASPKMLHPVKTVVTSASAATNSSVHPRTSPAARCSWATCLSRAVKIRCTRLSVPAVK